MAWIESHQGLGRHIKTKRLARRLKISIPTTVGHLHLLWWWAMDNLPDGRLTALEPEDIADEMMWNGDAGELLDALRETGFVDAEADELYIHDWHDYIGRLLERRKKETDRKREYRSKSQSCPTGQPTDETQDGGGNSTVPYLTIPKIKTIVDSNECDLAFEQFYESYPKGSGSVKKKSYESWKTVWKSKPNLDEILQGVHTYAEHQQSKNLSICAAQVFLNQERWKDNWSTSKQPVNKLTSVSNQPSKQELDEIADIARRQAARNGK